MTHLEITPDGRFNLRKDDQQRLAQTLVVQHRNRPDLPPEELHQQLPKNQTAEEVTDANH